MELRASAVQDFDLIVVGSSFAGVFFLKKYLDRFGSRRLRVLVLERGPDRPHGERLIDWGEEQHGEALYVNRTPHKRWAVHAAFGGASNYWWACTPRFMPNDFRMRTLYGVGSDWPLSYDDLEPHYCEAEEIMGVAGPAVTPYPRSRPYPQPPHYMTTPEEVLNEANPLSYLPMPTARWSIAESDPPRAQCCTAGVCFVCPVDAKFTIENSLRGLFEPEHVDLRLHCAALRVETKGNVATGVTYLDETSGKVTTARADLVVLGANAVMNPYLLMRSGLRHPLLGKRLGEQISTFVTVKLNGIKGLDGGSSLVGHGYQLYDGAHRAERSAILLESHNVPRFRVEQQRWREVMHFKAIAEILPDEANHVGIDEDSTPGPDAVGKPYTYFTTHGDYPENAFSGLEDRLAEVFAPLPVESIDFSGRSDGESHITGTTMMGNDSASSVIDRNLAYHGIPNLIVAGSGAFPTSTPSNPTLTLAALSLWAADRL